MELPESAADKIVKRIPDTAGAFIINPFSGKEKLTIIEAIDCINHLSGVLLADECIKTKAEYKKYL